MRARLRLFLLLLAACLAAAGAASAETVYKYRRPDGRTVYSNRLLPSLELIETFDYKFAEPAPADPNAAKHAADVDARIRKQLDALQAAWTEVQDARRALTEAEARLRAGVEPEAGERQGVATSSVPPAVGGPQAPVPPAAGGPMAGGHRGRSSPEYLARMQALENGVKAARARLDAALQRYNELR